MLDLAFSVKDAINGEETVMKYIVNCLLALCVFVIASPVAVNAAEPTDGGAGGQAGGGQGQPYRAKPAVAEKV